MKKKAKIILDVKASWDKIKTAIMDQAFVDECARIEAMSKADLEIESFIFGIKNPFNSIPKKK